MVLPGESCLFRSAVILAISVAMLPRSRPWVLASTSYTGWMLAWLALPGTESRVKVAMLRSSPGTGCVVAGAVAVPTAVLARSLSELTRYSGVCTAMKYGMPLVGSVQKFGDTCSEELRLVPRLL